MGKPRIGPQYAIYASWAGLALVLLYTLGQWREIVAFFKRRNARYGAHCQRQRARRARHPGRGELPVGAAEQAVGPDGEPAVHAVDQTIKLLQGLHGPVKFMVFDQTENIDRFKPRLDEYEYQSTQVSVEYIDPDQQPVRPRSTRFRTTAPWWSSTWVAGSGSRPTPSRT